MAAMLRSALLLLVGLSGLAFVPGLPAARGRAAEDIAPAQPPGIAEQLHYIGRDSLTTMPTTVSDRFIAEVERSVALYGIEESKPIPAPPPGPIDLKALTIEPLGVRSAPVARFGVDRFGRLDVPQDNRTVGWNPLYTSLPGLGQSTFLAAHFEYLGVPGVFNRISTLKHGDALSVTLTDGTQRRYRVTSAVDYALGAIDMSALLHGREGVESLILMTCSGPPNEGAYPLRTVVLAEAVSD